MYAYINDNLHILRIIYTEELIINISYISLANS